MIPKPIRVAGAILPCAVMVIASACGAAPPADADTVIDEAIADDIAALREAFADFDRVSVARDAGYTEQITSCWYRDGGGAQGIHVARPELIDGTISLLEPELVMYEQQPDGTLAFLAVEYIIPFTEWSDTVAPQMLGQSLRRNERLQLYVLHVWIGRDNPNGLFADWSPNVSCEHDPESEDRST